MKNNNKIFLKMVNYQNIFELPDINENATDKKIRFMAV